MRKILFSSEILCALQVDERILIGDARGCLSYFNVVNKVICEQANFKNPITAMSISDGYAFIGDSKGLIQVVRIMDFSLLASCKTHSAKVNCILPFNDQIWSCSNDSTIKIWIVRKHSIQVEKQMEHHDGLVTALIQVNKHILSSGRDGHISVWNRQGNLETETQSTPHNDTIRVLYRLNNLQILSGGYDNALTLWDQSSL